MKITKVDNDSPEVPKADLIDVPLGEDALDLGEPSTIETAKGLKAVGAFFAQKALKSKSDERELKFQDVQNLTALIEAEIPFYFQGAGISTLPRQLELYNRLKPLIQPGGNELEKEFRSGLDCKFPTVVLGFALIEMAKLKGQNLSVYLLTKGKSPHPSVLVGLRSGEWVQIDFENRFVSSPPKSSFREIVMPDVARQYTRSFSKIEDLRPEKYSAYQKSPYILHPLNAEALNKIDNYFLES